MTQVGEGGAVGLFSRKAKAAPGPGVVVHRIGTMGQDSDYETEVVGESKYRDAIVAALQPHRKSLHYKAGRVPVPARIVPLGPRGYFRVAVEIDGRQVGYVEDAWSKRYAQTYETIVGVSTSEVRLECGALIIWRAGDPLSDPTVPLGVRLDLHDDASAQALLGR